MNIPFEMERGLFQVPLRKATGEEMDELATVWLTSNHTVWDPTVLDRKGEQVLPLLDGRDIEPEANPSQLAVAKVASVVAER